MSKDIKEVKEQAMQIPRKGIPRKREFTEARLVCSNKSRAWVARIKKGMVRATGEEVRELQGGST